jgi:chaperonin GroES
MLNLEEHISLTPAAISSPNLCDRFSEVDLNRIGEFCAAGYDEDEQSRQNWLDRNEAGMDLALQIAKDKSFPWPNCANIQFHARAYPGLISGNNIVKYATFGATDPQLIARSSRVATHMSWQLLHEDRAWEEQADKGILNVSIVGTNFKKTRFSSHSKTNVSELVLAKDLAVNYWTKSLDSCSRATHIIPTHRNEIYEGVGRGIYRDVLEESWYVGGVTPQRTTQQMERDNRQGVQPPPTNSGMEFILLEQHTLLDLDGDGYAEPYIITFDKTSRKVLRIVANFEAAGIEYAAAGSLKGKIIKITPTEYFTKYEFIPSPDGGFYGIGFGVFLGPLNESVNSIINMLLDCGTLQTTAGGFLGRGAKLRGGTKTFSPFEWKTVDASGDDLRKSIFALPVNQPSPVLFQLLGLLIDYASRVSGTTDITVGENPGQNTPAQTSNNMIEMGQKVYTAIFKRMWRAMKEEFRKLYVLNGIYLREGQGYVGGATKADYTGPGYEVCPVADPNLTSDQQLIQQAVALKAAAGTTPGYNADAVERRFLSAIRIENPQEVFTGTEGMPPPKDPKLVIEETKIAGRMQEMQLKLESEMQQFIIEMQEEHLVNQSEIIKLQAQAAEAAANAQSEAAYAQVALINAEISQRQTRDDTLQKRVEALMHAVELRTTRELEEKKLKIEERKLEKTNAD